MPKDGRKTRSNILEQAHCLVMQKGFAGTSIDMVLEAAQITKGAFFYHFKNKSHLAVALAERYAKQNDRFFSSQMQAAEKANAHPLDRLLGFLDGLTEAIGSQPKTEGCLFAGFGYEADGFEPSLQEYIAQQMVRWRNHYATWLRQIAQVHPPYIEIDMDELADAFLAAVEGGYVMGRLHRDPNAAAIPLRHYRQYIEFVFDV